MRAALGGRYYAAARGNLDWIDPENELPRVLRATDPAAMERFIEV